MTQISISVLIKSQFDVISLQISSSKEAEQVAHFPHRLLCLKPLDETKTMSFGWFPNNWLKKNKTDKDNKIAEIADLKSELLVLEDQGEAKTFTFLLVQSLHPHSLRLWHHLQPLARKNLNLKQCKMIFFKN